MQSPRTKKDVQSLNGKLAALKRFLSQAADRSLPFFQTLKGFLNIEDFVWMEDAEKAFQDMKAFLKELPTLTVPIQGETLAVYLAASPETISSVLIADMGKTQMPVYFVRKVLQNGEVNYPAMEKLIYALVHTARQLQRYFQAHPIQILMDQPIKHVLTRPEISGRMAKWELYTDGSSTEERVGIGLLLVSPNGEEITYAIRLKFAASNNEAEYEALLVGLRLAKSIDVQQLTAYVNSQLVASQLNGNFEARDISMQKYLELAKALVKNFAAFKIKQIPRNRNKKADALRKLASLLYDHFTKKVMVEVLKSKSTNEDTLMATITEEEDLDRSKTVKHDYRKKILTFVWEDIVSRFSLPREIVSDNGTQIAHNPFKDWCIDIDMQQSFTSVAYPQANGQVEVTNRDIVTRIKARLGKQRHG
ncbi:uncharacterized protein [Rutidosis leptorrhynchoides]|uniref:uncharacterized protein n=1 Tax=Rutidosis leptorrhynchoides TaxID=125765 RepID=UPI003A9962AC